MPDSDLLAVAFAHLEAVRELLPDDAVVVVNGLAGVTVHDRTKARSRLLARGRLDIDQAHLLAFPCLADFVWVVAVDAKTTRCCIMSRPPMAAAHAA